MVATTEYGRKYGEQHLGTAWGIPWQFATKFGRPKTNFVA